jgi:hypothetical protein
MDDSIERFLDQMRDALADLIEEAKEAGREEVRAAIQGAMSDEAPAPKGASKKPAKARKAPAAKKKRKNPWETMTPEQREERVRKMLAGRGLKPKAKAKK